MMYVANVAVWVLFHYNSLVAFFLSYQVYANISSYVVLGESTVRGAFILTVGSILFGTWQWRKAAIQWRKYIDRQQTQRSQLAESPPRHLWSSVVANRRAIVWDMIPFALTVLFGLLAIAASGFLQVLFAAGTVISFLMITERYQTERDKYFRDVGKKEHLDSFIAQAKLHINSQEAKTKAKLKVIRAIATRSALGLRKNRSGSSIELE